MSSKPTHTAYVVIDPKEGSDKKAQWFEIGTVWSHNDGERFRRDDPARCHCHRPHRLPQAQEPAERTLATIPRRSQPAGFFISAKEILP